MQPTAPHTTAGLPLPAMVRELAACRGLALALARRDIAGAFAGSTFGAAWALLHPLLQMLVYLAVFSFIFGIRFEGAGPGAPGYAAYVLAGLVSWLAWAGLLVSAATSVTGSGSLVRQADFPTRVLPLRTVLAAGLPHAVALGVLLVHHLARHGAPPWTWALLPLALVLQGVAMLGVAYVVAALAVFVRDVREVLAVFTTLGLFLTPALYTPSMLEAAPRALRLMVELNPFTHFVYVYRDALFFGAIDHPVSWAVAAAVALVSAGVGYRLFERLEGFFGDFV